MFAIATNMIRKIHTCQKYNLDIRLPFYDALKRISSQNVKGTFGVIHHRIRDGIP